MCQSWLSCDCVNRGFRVSIVAVVCQSWLSCVNRGLAVVSQSWLSCVNCGCRVSIVAVVCQLWLSRVNRGFRLSEGLPHKISRGRKAAEGTITKQRFDVGCRARV